MKRLLALLAAVPVLLVGGFASGALAQSSAPAAAPSAATYNLTAPITGTTTTGGTFSGTYTLTRFASDNGALSAVGTLTGTLTDPTLAGGVPQPVSQSVSMPLDVSGSCQILDLTLGPLHLDLLGLVVDLNQVHLTITAQQGPGNLLGNLLCAVANLLNGSGGGIGTALNQIVALLNQILGAL